MADGACRLSFSITGQGELFRFFRGGAEVAGARYRHGRLRFYIWYTFGRRPLWLLGNAKIGDDVCVRILPQRIELLVNGAIVDEEWPCGEHRLEGAQRVGPADCAIEPYEPEEVPQPSVLGTFLEAEDWHPEEEVYVGDCMPYTDEGRYHVLYLRDRHRHTSKWALGAHQWAHISTADFREWQIHPLAVAIERPDEGSICTGSWIRSGDTHYLYFTIRSCDGSPARIGRSVSEDGYHFRRDRDFVMYLSERYNGARARDPKVFRDESGRFHMLLTTTLEAEKRGCLAHLTSDDLDAWREEDAPFYLSPNSAEPECCDYFTHNGWHYLVYSLTDSFPRYLYSREPLSGWREPDDPKIPCKSVPKAAVWNGRIIFTGFEGYGRYAGTMTFMEAAAREDGQLRFFRLGEG